MGEKVKRIALSIVFLAVEITRQYRGNYGITYHYPWMISFLFGLIHGLGFAGALAGIGLPQQAIPLALLLFNRGVEIGQLIFVFASWLLIRLFQSFLHTRNAVLRWIPVYAIGSAAGFWLIGRVVGLLKK
jgi:hypothetical protein